MELWIALVLIVVTGMDANRGCLRQPTENVRNRHWNYVPYVVPSGGRFQNVGLGNLWDPPSAWEVDGTRWMESSPSVLCATVSG